MRDGILEGAKTKKGAASIYIVIFTTTLLSIIALSFVRIMLSESQRTTNYSLSQSAYDSALAGVEDAKIALLRYQDCIDKGGSSIDGSCNNYYVTDSATGTSKPANLADLGCDVVRKLLTGNDDKGEQTISTGGAVGLAFDQAYTCVKIETDTDDFVTTLSESRPVELVPLRTKSQEEQNRISKIRVEWFSHENYTAVSNSKKELNTGYYGNRIDGSENILVGNSESNIGVYNTNTTYKSSNKFRSNEIIIPPVVQLSYFQTGQKFSLKQLYSSYWGGLQSDRGTLMLVPSSKGVNSSNSDKFIYSANKSFNKPINVKCSDADGDGNIKEFSCSFTMEITDAIGATDEVKRNMSTNFVLLSLPYSAPETDVRIAMLDSSDNIIQFANVEPRVDSTGRANDLFRRVEARVKLYDDSFAIPNYALASTGDGEDSIIKKNFYVAPDCQAMGSSYYSEGKDDEGKTHPAGVYGQYGKKYGPIEMTSCKYGDSGSVTQGDFSSN